VTGGANATTNVTQAMFVNSTSATINLTVQIKIGSAGALTLIPSRSVAAGAVCIPPELAGFPLNPGDEILASGAGLVAVVNGYTVT